MNLFSNRGSGTGNHQAFFVERLRYESATTEIEETALLIDGTLSAFDQKFAAVRVQRRDVHGAPVSTVRSIVQIVVSIRQEMHSAAVHRGGLSFSGNGNHFTARRRHSIQQSRHTGSKHDDVVAVPRATIAGDCA